jgi:gamma-glutamyltranspeptidase/glutathione hydrolase
MWFDPTPGRINSLLPGRRGMTAGAPVLVTRDGRPVLAVGAPGGRRVISSVIQSISNMLDHGMGPQEAVTRPRVHSEAASTEVDKRVGEDHVEALSRLGHQVVAREETFSTSYFGRPLAVMVDPKSGRLRGGVNHLKPTLAIGL